MSPRQRWTIPIGLVLLVAIFAILLLRDTPRALYEEARTAFDSDSARCEQLLNDAIDRSGGDYPAAQVLRCRLMGRSGKWLEALGYFSTIEDPSQAPGDQLVDLGNSARVAGAVVLARFCFEAAAKSSGEYQIRALERLAALEQEIGNLVAAREAAEKLLAIDEHSPVAALVIARVARAELDVVSSATWYQRAVGYAEDDSVRNTARSELIRVLIDLGDARQAREHWQELSASATLTGEDHLLVADLLRLEGRSRESVELIEILPAQIRMSERALFLTGLARLDLDEPQAAVDALRRVLQYNPYYKEAHYKLATAYQRLGNDAEAEKHFATAKKLTDDVIRIIEIQGLLSENPNQSKLIEELIRLYRETGREDFANDLAEQLKQTAESEKAR